MTGLRRPWGNKGTMIREVSAQHLYIQTNCEAANRDGVPWLRTRHALQRNSCWKNSDKNDMIDTVLQGWKCPPIYIIHHKDLIERATEGEYHVFDGAHKLESLFEFMNDDRMLQDGKPNPATKYFSINAPVDSSLCKDMKDNHGKFFHELPAHLRRSIRDYTFTINMIDDETAHDPDRLRTLWERLNKKGVKLNSFELQIPVIRPLIEYVLVPVMPHFIGSMLFQKEISQRGELEQRLQVILALCDFADHKPHSQSALIVRWHKEQLGNNMTERSRNVSEKTARWIDILTRVRSMLRDLEELNVFHKDGESTLTEGLRKTELPFVLGRLARAFPRIEHFRQQKERIASCLRTTIFCKTADEMLRLIGGSCRDGRYQKKLVEYIDTTVIGTVVPQPRLFTTKQKAAKLKEQGGKCAICSEVIHKHQIAEGDHIIAWSDGGETTMENLQILHRLCHQAKTGGGSNAV